MVANTGRRTLAGSPRRSRRRPGRRGHRRQMRARSRTGRAEEWSQQRQHSLRCEQSPSSSPWSNLYDASTDATGRRPQPSLLQHAGEKKGATVAPGKLWPKRANGGHTHASCKAIGTLLPIAGLLLVATLGRRVPLRLPRLWVEVVGRAVPAGGSKEESLLISKEGGVAAGAPYGAAEGPRLQSRVG